MLNLKEIPNERCWVYFCVYCCSHFDYDADGQYIMEHGKPKTEFVVSHGVDEDTGRTVVVDGGSHPLEYGAVFDEQLNDWVLG